MDASTLGRGRLIAAIGGIALLIIMFLPWFGLGGEAAELAEQAEEIQQQFGGAEVPDTDESAWKAFDIVDLVLFAAALAAIVLAVATMTRAARLPRGSAAIVAGLGALATLLVLFRLIDPPELSAFPSVPGFEIEVSRKIGAFLGLIASAAIAAGGWLAMQEEGSALGRDRLRGPGDPPPPAPGGAGPGTGAGGTGSGAAPPPPPPVSRP